MGDLAPSSPPVLDAAADAAAQTLGDLAALFAQLDGTIRGTVYNRSHASFAQLTRLWNGNLVCTAKAVVCPVDAADVSLVVQFCSTHRLSLSVKAGGYAVAGWAVAGQVILDLCLLSDIDIEPPQPPRAGRDWTPLAGMAAQRAAAKGKARADAPDAHPPPPPQPHMLPRADSTIGVGAKRVRSPSPPTASSPASASVSAATASPEADKSAAQAHIKRRKAELDAAEALGYDGASRAVARFMAGPPLPHVARYASEKRSHPLGRAPPAPACGERADCKREGEEEAQREEAPFVGRLPDPFGYMFDGSSKPVAQPVHTPHPALLPPSAPSTGLTPAPAASTDDVAPADVVAAKLAQKQKAPEIVDSGEDDAGGGADPFGYLTGTGSVDGTSVPAQLSAPRAAAPARPPPAPTGTSHTSSSSSSSSSASRARAPAPGDAHARAPGGGGFRPLPAEPIYPHAYVTFGAGMKQREVDMYTAAHPLPARTLAGSPTTVAYHVPFAAHPVGSAVMLLGGFGFLSRLHGLSIDNVVEVEMVLADGRIVHVSADSHPDLWWAIRGGGPAFGIATRYKTRCVPVPLVYAGNLIYRFHRATAPSLIKHLRDCVKAAPRAMYANVLLTAGPADQDSLVVVQMCFVGPREKGAEQLQALCAWDGEPCVLNEVNEKSFLNQQDSIAQVLRGQHGRKWFIRSTLITALPDDLIHKTVTEFADTPVGCSWFFELAGGAIADVEDSVIPASQRAALFTVAALHQWDVHVHDPRCEQSAEHWIHETLAPVSTGAPYTCFLGRNEPRKRVEGCFGAENWARLREIKRRYDPANVFRYNFWAADRDESAGPVEPAAP